MPISIHQGDILTAQTDALVNPANSFLMHGGGLARLIDRAARGPELPNPGMDEREWWGSKTDRRTDAAKRWDAENRSAPNIATGSAYATSAGVLPFKRVIHAVGPIWAGGGLCEEFLLKAAHQNACAAADEAGCRSIAFPAISCGIFGFPVQKAAYIAIGTVAGFWTEPQPDGIGLDVQFWLFEDAHYDAFEAALEAL